MIRYQVENSDDQSREAMQTEYEGIPLSLLGDLEKYDEKKRQEQTLRERSGARKRRKRRGKGKKRVRPPASVLEDPEASRAGYFGGKIVQESKKSRERLYLFYLAPKDAQSADDSELPPFQSMLWSLVAQVLVWRSRLMGVFLGWLGAIKPELDHLETVPTTDRLKMFFRCLLQCLGVPVVITVCHMERISDVYDPHSVQFLADLGSSQSDIGIAVHLILSTSENVPMPSEIQRFESLSRNTERNGMLPCYFLLHLPPSSSLDSNQLTAIAI